MKKLFLSYKRVFLCLNSRGFRWILFYTMVVSLSFRGNTEEPKQDSLTARQILDHTATIYRECKSYHDSGVVKTVLIKAGGNLIEEKPFITSFIRPDRFRFEYFEKEANKQERRYFVWQKRNNIVAWRDFKIKLGIDRPKSISSALAGAMGVSGGSAYTIPRMLLPDQIKGWSLTDMSDIKRIDDSKIENNGCYCIQGRHDDSPMTLWIDKETFLVRRIDSQHKFDNFRTESITTYDSMINGEITEKMLEYIPLKPRKK